MKFQFKKTALAVAFTLTAAMAAVAGFAGQSSAEVYDGANTLPTKVPTFNSITGIPTNGTGVPATGNEPDFFEGAVTGSGKPFGDPINDACVAGTTYTYRVYVHNNASDLENGTGNGSSVAHDTKVAIALPSGEASTLVSKATISANNAASVSDNMTLNCNGKKVSLSYVAGSASQYSEAGGNQALSDSIVTSGALIGTKSPNGDMWGCWHQRVWVTIKVVVKEVTPPAPVYACDVLTVTKTADRTYSFTVNYTAKNGATFKNASFDFGDGTDVHTTTDTTVSHAYAKDGSYNAKASVTFTANGEDYTVTSGSCAKPVTVSPKNCEVPGFTSLPSDSPDCAYCTLPGKEDIGKKDTACQPTVMPSTGAGNTVALFVGISAFAAGAHYIARRFLARQ